MILKVLSLVIATAAISFLLVHAEIFKHPRAWILRKSKFFGDLVSCCYCLGHWIAAVLIVIMPVRIYDTWLPLDYLLTWFVISWAAGVLSMLTSWIWGEPE